MAALALYAAVAALAFALKPGNYGSPLYGASSLGLGPLEGLVLSLLLGIALAAATLWFTQVALRRSSRFRALHEALRPFVHRLSDPVLLALALASGFAEEALFRGALVPYLGVVASSVIFGALHQVPGRGRWVWMLWACAMGMLFAGIFSLTGQLAGAALAHVAINYGNLRVLRDWRAHQEPASLGGLLRRP